MAKHLYEVVSTDDGEQTEEYVIAPDLDKAIKKVEGEVIRVNLVAENVKE